MRTAAPLLLSPEERSALTTWAHGCSFPLRLVQRAHIVQMAAEGTLSQDIARELNVSRPTVQLWRERFLALRLAGLEKDAPRPGRIPRIPEKKVRAIVEATLHSKPPNATHWSTRSMAKAQGLSQATIRRIWKQHNLNPHLIKTFKISRDKHVVEKLYDVVGLYLNPPDTSLVLCVDEKSQIQALDRTQPGLPVKKGRCGTMTHDDKRHSTTTLFAALSMLDGKVIGECMPRHRHQEFIRVLNKIDRETSAELDLHIIVDNYATHTPSSRNILAPTTSTLPSSLHPDFEFLGEHGGAWVPRSHRQAHSSRPLQECAKVDHRDPKVSGESQPESPHLHVDRVRREHFGQSLQM